ncbi:putative coatomer/calthrin adaptor appendage subdomain, TBP domain superfamily [Arabidopsis thaliana]
MQSCKGTETVASNARSHTCLLSGLYIGNVKVLVKAQFGMDSSKEIVMKLAVRAEDPSVMRFTHLLLTAKHIKGSQGSFPFAFGLEKCLLSFL